MIVSQGPSDQPGRTPLLTGLAVAGLSLAVAWLATGILPSDLLDRAPMPEAERMAMTMLACAVAALAVLAGIAAFALERSLEPPAQPKARRPRRAPTRRAQQGNRATALQEAA